MSMASQAQPASQQPMRYGDLDEDDDEEFLPVDIPVAQKGDANGAAEPVDEEQRAADLAAAQALPGNVKNFITALHSALSSNHVAQIHSLYTSAWNRLTQEHYATTEWPEVEVVSMLTDGDEVFGLFYRELYFRHIYSKLQPNIDDRFASYENYCAVFNYILNSEGPVPIELPTQWLWDVIDEFVWQFSTFAQWRSRTKGKTEEEITLLAENPQVWSCYSVLNVLYSLIQKSRIQDQLRAVKKGEDPSELIADAEDGPGEYGTKPLYRLLGTYSLVTLVRVHALLGDYSLALKMLDDVDMKRLPTRDVPAAHVSVHYYVGFSYLMLGRHADAIYHLSKGYAFFTGPSKRARPAGSDAVAKQADRMLALLAVAHALSPTKWDESREVREAREALRASEKYNDQFETMSRGGQAALSVFEELFRYGSPKTISPHSPPYDRPRELENFPDAVQNTVQSFMNEVRILINVPDLRTLLKLYTSIGTKKLALLAAKDEEELLRELMVLKGSMKTVKWTEESERASPGLLAGEEAISASLGFSIDKDTINITEQRKARQFTGRFLSQGLAAKQLLDGLRSRPLPTAIYSSNSSASANGPPQRSELAPVLSSMSKQKSDSPAKSVAWAATKA